MSGTPKVGEIVGIGQVLLGKYRVESIVGHGGMGVVAQCMHIALNERVAIKMMRRDVTDDPGAIERFMREAQAAVKLKSEHVARVSDVGTFDDGTPYIVMEYLEGHDLGQLLEQRKSVSIPWAATMMLQAADALAEAHSLNIVHRDIKPTNLFVTWRPDGTPMVKVLDFGISKVHAVADLHLTNTQSLLGTPAYMSPEQMRSARQVDARTDLWALGVVMYELVEGRRPFVAESFTELCVKVSIDPPDPMVIAPPELQRVILKCLEKNPAQRYRSMSELGRDLLPFVTNQHEAVIIVQRMRMIRGRTTEHDSDPTTRVVSRGGSDPDAAASSPPVAEDTSVDREPVSSAKPWPEVTPTTQPDVRVAQILQERMHNRETANAKTANAKTAPAPQRPPDQEQPTVASRAHDLPSPIPKLPSPTVRAPIVPVRPPPPVDEGAANDDDTIFEVGSTHVPFSDRRGDDLVRTPRLPTPLPPAPPLLLTTNPVRPPTVSSRSLVVLLIALLVGAGMLAIAAIVRR